MTCCFFASLKTLLISTKATALRRNQRPRASSSLAGFEVTLIGRFWVIPEVLHATLTVGDNVLMGSDPVPEQYEQPKGFAVLLGIDDPVDAERIFHGLAENGTVQMPLQKTFWSVRFGGLVDQFGIPWAINCEQAPSVA